MGQYYYIPDQGEQRGNFAPPMPDRMAQLRQSQFQQQPIQLAQPIQPAPPIQQQNGGMIWVSGKAEADNWPIAPGCAVALWDSNAPVIYQRKADSAGKPSTTVYDLVERTDAPTQQAAPQIDLSNYITRDQLEEILAERLKRPVGGRQKKEEE